MSDSSGPAMSGALILEERDGGGASTGREPVTPPEAGPVRCGGCGLWPRQQTWLCAVPLVIGFIGLGLSLVLLRWIVVGSVQDYVPTDLVDANRIGQDAIFLSKPSTFPKNSDTTTESTATSRTGPGTHSTTTASGVGPSGSGSQTPHPHNRISTRISTTTRAPRLLPPAGREVTPRGTVRRVGTGGGRNSAPSPTSTTRVPATISAPPPSTHPALHNSTQTWVHERSPKGPSVTPARPHVHVKTLAPTSPPLRSEHFKPCREKDLAYCLNEGECFVIETLTGSHKHCRCKEGYQGVRCDQFLPKTDSILSDPTDNLGIEFMESKETYKRQVLSISCITIGISLLGTLCMALYCRNKKRGEKLQAHLKELKVYNASSLTSKAQHKYCQGYGSSPPQGGTVRKSASATPPFPLLTAKYRSPDQRNRAASHWTSPRRTPPISRGRLNPIGGCRDTGPIYQHLHEVSSSERELLSSGRHHSTKTNRDPRQDASLNMQSPTSPRRVRVMGGDAEGQVTHLLQASMPSLRSCSIPIIPSVQGRGDTPTESSASSSVTPGDGQRGALLLEQDHVHRSVLPHADTENHGPAAPAANQVDYFPSSDGAGEVAKNKHPLMNLREPYRESVHPCK